MSLPHCYIHQDAPARGNCHRCLQPICSVCRVYEDQRARCPRCVVAFRRLRGIKLAAIGLLVLSMAGGTVFSLLRDQRPDLSPELTDAPADTAGVSSARRPVVAHGKLARKIQRLQGLLEEEPCDRSKTLSLAGTLNSAGDYRAAVRRAERYWSGCGKFELSIDYTRPTASDLLQALRRRRGLRAWAHRGHRCASPGARVPGHGGQSLAEVSARPGDLDRHERTAQRVADCRGAGEWPRLCRLRGATPVAIGFESPRSAGIWRPGSSRWPHEPGGSIRRPLDRRRRPSTARTGRARWLRAPSR